MDKNRRIIRVGLSGVDILERTNQWMPDETGFGRGGCRIKLCFENCFQEGAMQSLGKKLGMTRMFWRRKAIAVTVVSRALCVIQKRRIGRDGLSIVLSRQTQAVNKPLRGTRKKSWPL
jgi:hypothetical protein